MDKCAEMKKVKNGTAVVSDERLMELFWQRDERAIAETDCKYGKMLLRIAYNILHDTLDAEECKNDTYLGVWNAVPPERPKVFPAFLSRIMRNIAVNRYKKRTGERRIPTELTVSAEELFDIPANGETPETELSSKELGSLINAYIKSLPERQRYVFIGRFYMAETMEHLANRLSVGVGTVHRDVEKIKEGLRVYLERNGVIV